MKKYTSNTRSITALPRSKRLRQAGMSATAVQSAAYESGDWLPRSVWDSVFAMADDGTLRVRTDLLVAGGVTMYADGTAEGGSGSGSVIVVDGLESTMADAALSANMGRVLKEMIDSKSTVTSWAQLEGKPTTIAGFGITDAYTRAQTASLLAGYLTTETAAATYVTLATEQTVAGAKTFAAVATFAAGATVPADQTLTVGGVTLSRHSAGTLFVDGNIVVSGGVTIYGDGGASGGSGGVVVVDGLESTMTDAALSANMGRVLKEMIDNKSTVTTWAQLEGKPTTIAGFGITDAPTKTGAGASGTWGISVSGSASRLAELINNDNVVQLYRGVRSDGTFERRIYDDGFSLIIEGLKSADTITVQTGGVWVQGGSAAGGDNTRLTVTAGMPSDMAYNAGKRGLRLYSNAIALADPYNGNSNNDAGWIRHLETTADSGLLEIATGDGANESIVVRQYNISNQVAREAYLLNGSGDTSFPGKVTAAAELYTNGYVFSNSGWFQCNTANRGLYNAAGDARFYYNSSADVWLSDKAIIAIGFTATNTVNTSVFTATNGADNLYVMPCIITAPNLTNTHCVNIIIGKYNTKYNCGYIGYVHTSDGASSNYLTLGLHSQDRVINLTAAGNTGIGTIAPEAKLHIHNTTYPNIKMTTGDQECSIYYENGWGRGWAAGAGCWGYPHEFVIGEYKTVSAWRFRLDASGNLLVAGGITMYSDLRKKTAIEDVELRLDEIADAPLFSHVYKDDKQKTLHVGSSAQYWDALCPGWFTRQGTDGYYMMEIQNCALAAAISLGREVRRYESKTDKQIRKLKRRVAELEDEIELIKKNKQNNA